MAVYISERSGLRLLGIFSRAEHKDAIGLMQCRHVEKVKDPLVTWQMLQNLHGERHLIFGRVRISDAQIRIPVALCKESRQNLAQRILLVEKPHATDANRVVTQSRQAG